MKKHASLRFSHSTVALPVIPECLYRESSRQKKQERYWISDKLVLVKLVFMEMRNGEAFGNDRRNHRCVSNSKYIQGIVLLILIGQHVCSYTKYY